MPKLSKPMGIFIVLGTSLIMALLFYWWSGFIGIGVTMFGAMILYWHINWPCRPYPWEDDYGN